MLTRTISENKHSQLNWSCSSNTNGGVYQKTRNIPKNKKYKQKDDDLWRGPVSQSDLVSKLVISSTPFYVFLICPPIGTPLILKPQSSSFFLFLTSSLPPSLPADCWLIMTSLLGVTSGVVLFITTWGQHWDD